MNYYQRDIKKTLEDIPPHFWQQCNLTAEDIPVIYYVTVKHEGSWSQTEIREVKMLIERLSEEDKNDHLMKKNGMVRALMKDFKGNEHVRRIASIEKKLTVHEKAIIVLLRRIEKLEDKRGY